MSLRLAVGQSTTRSGLKNSVIMLPTRATVCGTPADFVAASNPAASRPDSFSSREYGLVSRSTFSVAIPAAVANGFPLSVPA